MKKYMKKPMKLTHSVSVKSTEDNDTLLSWDRVNVSLTDLGKAAGLGVLFDIPIKSIKAVVNAGEVGYIDIEFYGDPEEVREKLPEDLQCCWIMPMSRFPSDMDTFIVRYDILTIP